MFCKKRVINDIVVPETIEVINFTELKNIETITKALAYKIFEFDEIRIRLNYLPDIFSTGDIDLLGVVQRVVFEAHSYQIFFNKNLNQDILRKILSHEFVHIDQYESGDLQIVKTEYIWKGKPGSMLDVKYKYRPFEIDARRRQWAIMKDLKKVLYK